jgi:hypothetical protein
MSTARTDFGIGDQQLPPALEHTKLQFYLLLSAKNATILFDRFSNEISEILAIPARLQFSQPISPNTPVTVILPSRSKFFNWRFSIVSHRILNVVPLLTIVFTHLFAN